MPIKYTFPVISKSGHYYEVAVSPMPHEKTHVIDPCDSKCYPVWDKEMKEILEQLRKAWKR